MITRALRDALGDLVPWAQREHRGWWRSWSPGCGHDFDVRGQTNAALAAHDSLVDALATALVADRGEAGARRAAADLCATAGAGHPEDVALCRAVRLRLSRGAPRLDRLVGGIDAPSVALAVYLLTLQVVDVSRPAGYVWLEDLAEALLLPPTLIRQLRRDWSRREPVQLAASA